MRILVTGATGFVGRHVIMKLLTENHTVIASSTDETKAATFPWFKQVIFKEYIIGEQDDKINLFEYFEKPEVLLHLAWSGLPNFQSLHHMENVLPYHMYFLRNLILNGIKHITITGTCFEYGLKGGCLEEHMCTNPITAYGIAKDTLRKYIELLRITYGFSFKWVRFFYMYGEGQSAGSLIPQLEVALREGHNVFKMSLGEQLRDYLDVSIVASNIVKIVSQFKIDGIINCCSGLPISVREFVEEYLIKTNRIIQLHLGAYEYSNYEPMNFWGDTRILNQIINNE